jgi:hypothetical protein
LAIATVVALAAIAASAAPGWATVPPGAVTCNGTFSGSAFNLVVPAGGQCALTSGAVTQNVSIGAGATFTCTNATIGQNLTANKPAGIGINGCTIGMNVSIVGLSGPGPGVAGDSYICSSSIGVNLAVTNATGTIVIGAAPDCTAANPGNSVGKNLQVQNNSGQAVVSNNSVGRYAQCGGSSPPAVGADNTAGTNQGCPEGTQTSCPSTNGFCDLFASSADGSASGEIFTQTAGSGPTTIVITFETTPLPCTTPNTGDVMAWIVTNAGSFKQITYNIYGTAADNENTAHPEGDYLCYESPNQFTTASGAPAQQEPNGLYYGVLPVCVGGGDGPASNEPCIDSTFYIPAGESEGGVSQYTFNFEVPQSDPRASP